jgi:serine/threonine protein kinase
MTPERFRQIRNLFDASIERPTNARPAFIEEACQGDEDLREAVSRLLSAHQQTEDGPLQQPSILRGDAGRMEGRRIDHYEILRELGRGGMGSVYLAARTDQVYRKTVAFKVVRPEASSEDVIRRFQQEREIVAGLDHPNIARLLDGGTTPEGLPYFVMEFVDGQPIDVYCDQHQRSMTERLKLFRAVCATVEYAHGRGVAHRDLKPGNILVTSDGVVKLLDFGIAKQLGDPAESGDPLTRTGLRPMTPEYASPEQVKGESVGAASDQYSLGVVLYELLTGHRPYRMRSRLIHEVVRVICEEDPTLPSTAVTETTEATVAGKPVSVTPQLISRSRETTPAELRRELSGDLDNILLRALRKDPQRRYADVKDFSEDLQRRLEGQPVIAQPQGLTYGAGKFLALHKEWAIGGGLLVVAVAAGAVKISLGVAVFVLVSSVILAIAFFMARRDTSPDIAAYLLFNRRMLAILAAGFILAVLVPHLWPVFRFMGAEWWWFAPHPWFWIAASVIYAGVGAWGLFALANWPRRERHAGALLLDLSRKRSSVAYAWLAMSSLATLLYLRIILNARQSHDHRWKLPVFILAAFWPVIAYIFIIIDTVEIRERGIVQGGGFFRWSRVTAFSWGRREGRFVILKLQLQRFASASMSHPWVLKSEIVLDAEYQAKTDAILKRQLSEWPDGTAQSRSGTTE